MLPTDEDMILETMLQRLFASLVHGPSMNARPHRSRQRCDWMEFGAFKSLQPSTALKAFLDDKKIEFQAKIPPFIAPSYPEAEWSQDQKQHRDEHRKQTALLKKLRDIADDALEYMNDHGESCLALGFPLLSLPPAADEKSTRASTRVLAPLLLLPLNLQIRTASRAGVTIECAGAGADMLVANPALIAWLERQTGKTLGEVFADETATDPWREVDELLKQVAAMLDLGAGVHFDAETILEAVPVLEKLPKSASVLPAAVLGLFPLSNQSLLRDTRWMMENQEELKEPVSAFLNPEALHQREPEAEQEAYVTVRKRDFNSEWLVSSADPCQANAVLSSREAKALVVHGPPGTGKSQTITNMIADHLARGERVLFVCDKRTALDVVKYRLDAVGLGDLCGVVHDPSSDRKDFYMGLRAKLENLADAAPIMDPRPRLDTVNQQLSAIHSELDAYRRKLHHTGAAGDASFHSLLGSWLEFANRGDLPAWPAMSDLLPNDVEVSTTSLDEISLRAEKCSYSANPFRGLIAIGLNDFLSRNDIRQTLQAIHAVAETADTAQPDALAALVDAAQPITGQAAQREGFSLQLRSLLDDFDAGFLKTVLDAPEKQRPALAAEGTQVMEWLTQTGSSPLDGALLGSARSASLLSLALVNQHLAALTAWEAISASFFKKLFAGAAKKSAHAALAPLGLGLDTGVRQALAFYAGLKFRLLINDWLNRCTGQDSTALRDDSTLQCQVGHALTAWQAQTTLKKLGIQDFPIDSAGISTLACKLEADAKWLRQLDHLASLLSSSGIFAAQTSSTLLPGWLGLAPAAETTGSWVAHASTLEDLVRLRHALALLPASLAPHTEALVATGVSGEVLLATLRRQAVENVMRERLKHDSELAAIDGDRIEAAFDNFARLSQEKPSLVASYVGYLWQHHQKSRLLASTGTQLNKQGSGLRQRLYVKGKKALKLRQMLATGAEAEGGDPIYDLCPVWMASPSTVAQIFPRHPIFNVVIFDEASQCRLEEALPVLMRGQRVVIAGDQKQLPPTRFFESALTDSGDSDAETAEELFFQQQSEAEDLLTAALNLDVREAYLDVHYRSRNEALIGFSNQHYYGSRLQPIPGHPRNKALNTPIRLHRVDGVYQDRANEKEAEAAVNLVAELLAEEHPPSIGIACFNLTQKEAIHEAIAARIERDLDFARRYEQAKNRKGRDSFEGIFVKNLENVQGDERDVMIICTTFGPDPQGKFRRNFGALSQREGGRRLNVLVTRARDAVHVLTSIPAAEYANVQAAPAGQIPNGRLQLYAYLRYAGQLAEIYETYHGELEKMRRDANPEIKEWESVTPSPIASALAHTLLHQHQTGSHTHWGNEGFCVDVACIHPAMPADVTVGVLTDFSRFHKTPDPIEWDIFRTRVLRSQGWELERLWSPVLFRRPQEMLARIRSAHERLSKPAGHRELATDSPTA